MNMKYLKLFEEYDNSNIQTHSTSNGYLVYMNGSLIGGEWEARKEQSEISSNNLKTFYLIYDKDTDVETIEEVDIFYKMGHEYMIANEIASDKYTSGYYLISADDYNWKNYKESR